MEVDAVVIWWSVLLMCQACMVMRLLNKFWFETRRIRSVLSKQGIRGPRPTFPFGNVPEMQKIQSTMINNTHEGFDGQHLNHLPSVFPYIHEWEKEYGPIYMYSTGINQHLYVSDPKLLIEIKQHSSLDLGHDGCDGGIYNRNDQDMGATVISYDRRACFGSNYSFGNQIFEKITDMVEILGKPSLLYGFLNFSWFLPNKKVWNLRKEL
ncbi:hypothetical protein M0R45_028739 [Rubus argutus]|uniref:Cytochrome P450 n=1 Tax=Rubus argutus TaxID=59490 RepID=A0AAW1W5J7_RUBAR